MGTLEQKIVSINSNLLRFAYTLTNDREEANDLTQETLLKILSSENKYREDTNFKGWAFTIMKNIFINNYRKISKYQIVDNEYAPLEHMSQKSAYEPEHILNAKEIERVIDEYPYDLKQPFKLFVAGYSYKEISDKLEIPIGTVKSRIFSVREKLKTVVVR